MSTIPETRRRAARCNRVSVGQEFTTASRAIASSCWPAASISEGAFRTASVQFDSVGVPGLLGQARAIRLINLDLPDTAQAPGVEADFDNVRLFAALVLEPATWALALAGLGLLSLRRLRRA